MASSRFSIYLSIHRHGCCVRLPLSNQVIFACWSAGGVIVPPMPERATRALLFGFLAPCMPGGFGEHVQQMIRIDPPGMSAGRSAEAPDASGGHAR